MRAEWARSNRVMQLIRDLELELPMVIHYR